MITTVIFALAFVATLASAVLAVADVRRTRTETADAGSAAGNGSASANAPRRLRPSGVVWGGVFLLFELFLVIWSALGLVAQDPASAVVAAVALTAGGAMSFNRHRLASQLPAKLLAHPLACAAVALGLIRCADEASEADAGAQGVRRMPTMYERIKTLFIGDY